MSPRPHRRGRTLLSAVLALTTGITVIATAPPVSAHPGHEHLADITISPGDFQQVSLAAGTNDLGEAMSLAVLPDRSVIHTSRDGTVRVTSPSGATTPAGKLDVYTHDEEGLQGVAVDPGFATNRHVWLYYSPRLSTPAGDAPSSGTEADWKVWQGHLNLSRFTLKPDKTLDMSSEKVVLTVDNDRGQCCHVGGDIDFDKAGNLFRAGTGKTRPEIYAMGLRNPFRMSVDKPTGIVYLGEYGPDAGSADPNRGPGGQVEFDRITAAGNFGWPYCTGTNTTAETYNEFTFPDGPSGASHDCASGPENNSYRNTGLANLPPAKASWIKYGGDAGSPPEFGWGSE